MRLSCFSVLAQTSDEGGLFALAALGMLVGAILVLSTPALLALAISWRRIAKIKNLRDKLRVWTCYWFPISSMFVLLFIFWWFSPRPHVSLPPIVKLIAIVLAAYGYWWVMGTLAIYLFGLFRRIEVKEPPTFSLPGKWEKWGARLVLGFLMLILIWLFIL